MRRDTGASWSLLIKPIQAQQPHEPHATPAVTVLVRDSAAQPVISSSLLSEVFGLTPAEAALVAKLVAGESVQEAAESMGISINTARAQLASVFSKTQVNHQPQLISLVLSTVYNVWQ